MAGGLTGMALGDAYVNILAETSYLQSGLLRAQAMVSSFVGIAGSGLTKGLVGAMVGLPLVVGGAMVYSVKKFMEAEVVSKRLAGAIAMAGGNVDLLMPKYEKLADRISRVTKWDDEQVKSAMASALARGLSTKKMEEAIPAAVGLAARMRMDLNSAMNMVTRAGMGNTMMLQRYFPQLKQATTQTEKWAMIMKIGAAGMGMARGEINTISGAFGQMRKAVGEVFESIGQGLVSSGAFKSELQSIVKLIWEFKDSVDALIKGGQFALWIDTVIGGFRYMGNDIKYVGTMLWTLLIEPLARTVGYIVDRLAEIANILYEVGNTLIVGMIGVFKYISTALGSLAQAIITSLWEPIKRVVSNIGTIFTNMFDNIKAVASSAWEFIKDPSEGWKSPDIKDIFAGTTSFEGELNIMKESWKVFGNDLADASPFKATMEQLGTLKASLQTLGQGFATNPFEGYITKIEKIVTDYWAEDARISAALGQKGAKEKTAKGEKAPGGDVTSKASFSIISMADQWKKLQEGITKSKDEKDIKTATKDTAKNTSKTNELLNTLITNFSGGDTSVPLFSAGY
ncbi:MAG: hypothetical protein WC455_19365 [Dehalococcoidia bacterium]|jgi:hypothetical protein